MTIDKDSEPEISKSSEEEEQSEGDDEEEELGTKHGVSMDTVTNGEEKEDTQLTCVRPSLPMEKRTVSNRLVPNMTFNNKCNYDYV